MEDDTVNENRGQEPAVSPQRVAEQMAHQLSGYLRSEIQSAVASIGAEHDTLTQSIRAALHENTRSYAAHIEDLRTHTVTQLAEAAQQFNDRAETTSARAANTIDHAVARADELAKTNAAELRELVSEARAAEAREAGAAADRAKAEAEAAAARSRTEREKTEKATALLKLQGDVEVERMTRTVAFQNQERATLQSLKNERADMEDEFDRKAEAIRNGVIQYYPEMAEELERIVSNSKNGNH